MAISKVVSLLSNSKHSNMPSGTAEEARSRATEEPLPLDQMVLQLRQMFTAPHERLCEARFDEMLDILDEQKSATEDELDSIGRRIITLNTKLDNDHTLLSELFGDALTKSRHELELKIEALTTSLRKSLEELEQRLRDGLQDVTRSLAQHVTDNHAKRQLDREQTALTLEQRIAQWRAEIDDTRRGDMQEVASSMVDIGQRLMALRKM